MNPDLPKKIALATFILFTGGVGLYLVVNPPPEKSHGYPELGSAPVAMGDAEITGATDRSENAAATGELLSELRSLTSAEGGVDFQAMQAAIYSLVKKNPEAVAEFALAVNDPSVRQIALQRVAQAWANRNPDAAVRWADSIRNQDERAAVVSGVLVEVAQLDPAKAVQMAESHDLASLSPGMTGNLVQQWASRDYEAALRWTDGQRTGAQRDEMYVRLALVRARTFPQEAARLVSEKIPPGGSQEEAAISVVAQWAAVDPGGAENWANTFDAGGFRDRALKEISLATPSSVGTTVE